MDRRTQTKIVKFKESEMVNDNDQKRLVCLFVCLVS